MRGGGGTSTTSSSPTSTVPTSAIPTALVRHYSIPSYVWLEEKSSTHCTLVFSTDISSLSNFSPSGKQTISARKAAIQIKITRSPASADRTAHRQFQATGQPVSWTQVSDAMTSRLPRYEAKCVQRRCFQCRSVPLYSDITGTELPPASKLIPLEWQLTAQQLCHWEFLYNETFQQTFRPLLSKLSKRRQI